MYVITHIKLAANCKKFLGAPACPSDHIASARKMPNQSASRTVDVELARWA